MNSKERTLYLRACETLMIDPFCDLEIAAKMYRILVKKHHPDLGGSEEITKQLNAAYEIFQKYRLDYTPEAPSAESKQAQSSSTTYTPTQSPVRPHDIYMEVMGFDVNVSQLMRWHNERAKKWMEKKAKKKRMRN